MVSATEAMKEDSLSENSVHEGDRKILDYHEINERNKIDGKFLQLFYLFNDRIFFGKKYARGKYC